MATSLKQIGRLKVLSNDGIQDDLEYHSDIRGVGCRGEMRVDDLVLVQIALTKHVLNELTRGLHIVVRTCVTIVTGNHSNR